MKKVIESDEEREIVTGSNPNTFYMISSKPTKKSKAATATSADSYDFLINKGYDLKRIAEFDETINFIVEIYHRMEYIDYSAWHSSSPCFKKEPISRAEIFRLRNLKTYHRGIAADYCQNIIANGKQHYEIYRVLQELLSDIYAAGYLHKYTEEEIDRVRAASSMLATSMALDFPFDYKFWRAAPNNRFYRQCIFHRENTPSLLIYENTQSFNCFGCNQNGNIFSYLMRADTDITFPMAIETLAKAFKVVLPEKGRTNERKDIIEQILRTVESDFYKELIDRSREKTSEPIAFKKVLVPSLPVQDDELDEEYNADDLPF